MFGRVPQTAWPPAPLNPCAHTGSLLRNCPAGTEGPTYWLVTRVHVPLFKKLGTRYLKKWFKIITNVPLCFIHLKENACVCYLLLHPREKHPGSHWIPQDQKNKSVKGSYQGHPPWARLPAWTPIVLILPSGNKGHQKNSTRPDNNNCYDLLSAYWKPDARPGFHPPHRIWPSQPSWRSSILNSWIFRPSLYVIECQPDHLPERSGRPMSCLLSSKS